MRSRHPQRVGQRSTPNTYGREGDDFVTPEAALLDDNEERAVRTQRRLLDLQCVAAALFDCVLEPGGPVLGHDVAVEVDERDPVAVVADTLVVHDRLSVKHHEQTTAVVGYLDGTYRTASGLPQVAGNLIVEVGNRVAECGVDGSNSIVRFVVDREERAAHVQHTVGDVDREDLGRRFGGECRVHISEVVELGDTGVEFVSDSGEGAAHVQRTVLFVDDHVEDVAVGVRKEVVDDGAGVDVVGEYVVPTDNRSAPSHLDL